MPCSFANAAADCVDGTCIMGSCDWDYDDCNSDDSDGCEADLVSDPEHCGTCGSACSFGICCDGICDCDGFDADGDGCIDVHYGGDDCDDEDPTVCTGFVELCDGQDNDCDDEIDEYPDACYDGNDCTEDRCLIGQGCVNILVTGIPCDDNNDCTENDVCGDQGVCAGTPIDEDGDGHLPPPCGLDCDDNDPDVHPDMYEGGSLDSLVCSDGKDNDCDGLTDEYERTCSSDCCEDWYCGDDNPCNGTEICLNCECMPVAPVNCDDNEQCTHDVCDPSDGSCYNIPMADGTACDDGNECYLGDSCSGGICQMGPVPRNCTDAMPCTADSCDTAIGCINDPAAMTGAECRAAAGLCDAAEFCDGTNADCPADLVAHVTVECRPAAGLCDIADFCDGVNVQCTPDHKELSSTVCRAPAGECDEAENCDGFSDVCPVDVDLPNGTPCTNDGLFCTGTEECTGGACLSTGDPCLGAGEVCNETSDTCENAR